MGRKIAKDFFSAKKRKKKFCKIFFANIFEKDFFSAKKRKKKKKKNKF